MQEVVLGVTVKSQVNPPLLLQLPPNSGLWILTQYKTEAVAGPREVNLALDSDTSLAIAFCLCCAPQV